MKSYPINLNLKGRKCLVAGGGKVGERKVLGLLECGADVLVVSPKLTPALRELALIGAIRHCERAYESGDLDGVLLVFAATDDAGANRLIATDANAGGVLANIADSPGISDFTSPSVIRRGDLTVALSTGGKSPALARILRRRLENLLGGEYEIFVKILGILRERMKSLPRRERERRLGEVAESEIPEFIREQNYEKAGFALAEISGLGREEISAIFAELGK